ncbi:LysR substrate-binding domain-containing protein [Chryseobacterium rhizosphaerae]|jgi:Transcriptional regulator|uniref:LysR family transcriptional regulator n=1 Tax=Chryseobacterium rhizosphaerae TaxID=395937 RepID=A0ABX9II12_9FLAO|nr:LysR substrate-binding domain-containing protein [Chryseobacterium rhizosphaerae]REC72640.1 LysR family transcriptional regulator [Chryseobacterium rhizosphaerae]GEN69221.1 LysR family transcriptional regulator [Chryseobacterium rhizosphaerae]
MNITYLRYFTVVAQELHFGRAAKKLHITQPPLTRAIQQLEEELEVKLFERHQRKVTLTSAGDYLLAQSDLLFSRISIIETQIKRIAEGKEGSLHIAFVGSVFQIIQPYLKKFTTLYPKIKVTLSQYTTFEQIEIIKNGSADIGFIRSPALADNLEIVEIEREYFALITPPEFNYTIDSAEKLKALGTVPFILFPRKLGSGIYDQIISLCNTVSLSPDIIHEASQLDTIIRLVESGFGYSILPVSSLNGIKTTTKHYVLDFMPQQAVVAYCYNKDNQNAVLQSFLKLLKT